MYVPVKEPNCPDPSKPSRKRIATWKDAEGNEVCFQDDWREELNGDFRQPSSIGTVVFTFEELRRGKEEPHDYWQEHPEYWERVHVMWRQGYFIPEHATKHGPSDDDLPTVRKTFMRIANRREKVEQCPPTDSSMGMGWSDQILEKQFPQHVCHRTR
jgi:hypothetical protein